MRLLDVTPKCFQLFSAVPFPFEISWLFGGKRAHGLTGLVLHPYGRLILEKFPEVCGWTPYGFPCSWHFRIQYNRLFLFRFWLQKGLSVILFNMYEWCRLRWLCFWLRATHYIILMETLLSILHLKSVSSEKSHFLFQCSNSFMMAHHHLLHFAIQFSQTIPI